MEPIDILNNQFTNPPQHLAAAATAGQIQFPGFCQAWPLAKPILAALGAAIAWIPVYGQAASLVFNGLLAIADQEYQLNCVVTPSPSTN